MVPADGRNIFNLVHTLWVFCFSKITPTLIYYLQLWANSLFSKSNTHAKVTTKPIY